MAECSFFGFYSHSERHVTNSDDQNSSNPETDAPAEPISPQSEDVDRPTTSESPSAANDSAAETSDQATTEVTDVAKTESDLPAYEPLTPELVEDEAIRGDFMLRWAVILLALLLGIRHITETPTLVHIRSGEYLTANGILPPANDVFSYTAGDSPWVNLNWLFDIIVATLHGVGGGTALSIGTGLLAAIMFYMLVNIRRKDSPTWWNAVCAAIALAVVHQQFTVLPEIITLLGTVWMVRGLNKWSDDSNPKTLWCLVFSLCVWSNLDPRAYIGCLIMVGYMLGTLIKPMASDANKPPVPVRDLAIATVAGLAVLAVNPFGWQAWMSPVSIYTKEIPLLLSYSSGGAESGNLSLSWLFSEASIFRQTHQWISGLSLCGIALLSCLLNFRRVNLGLTFAFLFVLGLGVWHSHELTIAAIVGCALASLNGQDWHRANCRQGYSINPIDLIYGRFGRAATVLALAAFAWLGISGRLMTPYGKRIGLGFSPELSATMRGTSEDLQDAHEGNIYTFRLDQGDLLIWNHRKVFADSRVHVYATGSPSIIEQHDETRKALRPGNPQELTAADQRKLDEIWKKSLDQYQVTQVIPRLWGIPPDYLTYDRLLSLPDWAITKLGSTTAVFVRLDSDASRNFAMERRLDFVTSVFRTENAAAHLAGRPDWPQVKTGYQQFLTLPAPPVSNNNQKARHELIHAEMLLSRQAPPAVKVAIGLSLATDAIRNGQIALNENVNNADSYQILADSYALLRRLESELQSGDGYPDIGEQRYFQSTHAMRQLLTLRPNSLMVPQALMSGYIQAQRWDLAEEMLNRSFELLETLPRTEQTLQARRQLSDVRKQIEPRIKAIDDAMTEARKRDQNMSAGQLAMGLMSQGFPLKALQLLEVDKTVLADLPTQLLYALALAECSRLEEAARQFDAFDRLGDAPPNATPFRQKAAWIEMARGNYDGAIDLCRKRIAEIEQATIMGLLGTAPLIQPPPSFLGEDTWPVRHTTASVQSIITSNEVAELRWTIATCYLESGRNKEAARQLQELLDLEPDTHLRPVCRSYLELITAKEVAESPRDQVPILFEDDAEAEPKK